MESLAKNVDVQAVVCNVPGAAGIKTAQDMGIECVVESAMDGIVSVLDSLDPDLVCMAGFMRILPSRVTERYSVMNIHPSLLPLFPGLHAQRQAVEGSVKYSGCTVHMADAGVDTGRIILQDAVPVMPGDTEDTLSDRIILREHEAYVRAVRLFLARSDLGTPEPDSNSMMFDDAGNAAASAVGCGRVAYLWNGGGGTFAVSERSPADTPCVVSVPGDGADVVSARLRNLVDW